MWCGFEDVAAAEQIRDGDQNQFESETGREESTATQPLNPDNGRDKKWNSIATQTRKKKRVFLGMVPGPEHLDNLLKQACEKGASQATS